MKMPEVSCIEIETVMTNRVITWSMKSLLTAAMRVMNNLFWFPRCCTAGFGAPGLRCRPEIKQHGAAHAADETRGSGVVAVEHGARA